MKLTLPRIFDHRNYRIFFAGQMVSLMGTWMQQVALGWLVYRLTHSPFLLGAVSFASQAPLFFVTPFAGALADRRERRDTFVVTQSLCMVQALVLTVLTLTGIVNITMVLGLALFWGVVTAIETPVRQAFTIDMVGREDLKQAISLNAMMFNLARTIGPALGGILVALIGEGFCFLLNTLSYGAVLTSLLLMRLSPRVKRPTSHPLDDLRQGFIYVRQHPRIRHVLFLSTMAAFWGMSFLALLPAYARDVLHRDSDALGFVMAAFGFGAFAGAGVAGRLPERYIALAPIVAAGVLGTSLIIFANLHQLTTSLVFVFPVGFAYLMIAVTNNSRVQFLADDTMRGRVMSFYAMGALGSQALGALLLGSVADFVGVPGALTLGGGACVAASFYSYSSLKRQTLAEA